MLIEHEYTSDPALGLFQGEQRRHLLEELVQLVIQRRTGKEIYEYLVNQS
ncbi:hypothetical protein [Paenibacillus sp. 598K]|nr:hypothetical protein [Paenibacillus sp. 598K]